MIRSAVIADAHSITALWNDLIRETAVTFTTELKVCSDVEAMIMDPGRSVFICEQEGVFEGFALFGAFQGMRIQSSTQSTLCRAKDWGGR